MAMKKLVVCAASALFAAVASATTLYVAPVASGTEDGSDFDNAMTLAQAVGAIPAGTADAWNEIVLQGGTKESPLVYDFSAITASFSISKAYVRVRSEANDPATIRLLGGYTDNSVRCFTLSANTELSGLTITNWYSSAGLGAAVNCANRTTCLITNCVIATCKSSKLGGGCYQGRHIGNTYVDCCSGFNGSNESSGGAIYGADYVYDCTFTGNYCLDKNGAQASTLAQGSCFSSESISYRVEKCRFIANRAGVAVGGRDLKADACVTNCTFMFNEGNISGNARFAKCHFISNWNTIAVSGTFNDCTFIANSNRVGLAAITTGGTIVRGVVTGSGATSDALLSNRGTWRDCVVTNNNGKLTLFRDNRGITGCFIADNHMSGGNIIATTSGASLPNVDNCVIVSNTVAGALTSAYTFTNCLLAYNSTSSTADYSYFIQSALVNCTVMSNTCSSGSHSAACGFNTTLRNTLALGNVPNDVMGDDSSHKGTECNVTCEKFVFAQNGRSATWGTWTNFTAGVKAKLLPPDGLHPWGGYPQRRFREVVGAGSNELCTAETDLAGLPRVYGGTIDIGCYENQEPNPGLLLLVK